MLLLLLITAIVPFLTTAANGGLNRGLRYMGLFLHQMNNSTLDANSDEACRVYEALTEGFLRAEGYGRNSSDNTVHASHSVLWAEIQPPRCDTTSATINSLVMTIDSPCCDKAENIIRSLTEINSDLRREAIIHVLMDGGKDQDRLYNTTVVFDVTATIRRVAFNSLLLQLSLLLLILFSLGFLRSDAIRLVIAPLRRMLKIVLRYAENPLVGAPNRSERSDRMSANDADGFSDALEDAAESDTNNGESSYETGSYETEQLITAVTKITDLLRKCWGVAGAGIISSNLARNMGGKNTVVFNPTVPGKSVYALFGFACINDFSHLLRSLDKDVMLLINDVAQVVHNEVYRWGYGDSGQCNKNLGQAFLMVYRIGDVQEVQQKKAMADYVIFPDGNKDEEEKAAKIANAGKHSHIDDEMNSIQLASLPGIGAFADRALLGLLKSFAGINRETSVKNWENDYRLGAMVGAFSVEMSFGMDAGWAVEGAVGSEYKIDATYLSTHVNMASRMMCAARQYRLTILVTQAVEELLSRQAREVLRYVDRVYVKGSTEAQRIYTYDARYKGVDFFLYIRSDADADKEAKKYSPAIWTEDFDLIEMRSHITPEFVNTFSKGRTEYLNGNFSEAVKLLKAANEIMIQTIVDGGKMESVNSVGDMLLDSTSNDEEVICLRNELGDGPCQTLVAYMEKEKCMKPDDWDGVRQLTSK